MHLIFRRLDDSEDLSNFDCGREALNLYLKNYALLNQRRRLGGTVMAYAKDTEGSKLAGYFTLAAAEVRSSTLPKKYARGLPYPILPAIRLCRLAVDRRFQGKGFGSWILAHALRFCDRLSKTVGGYAVLVDAKDEAVAGFYRKYGFQPFADSDLHLCLALKARAKVHASPASFSASI